MFQLNKVVFKPLSDTFVPTCSKSWSINLINKLFPRSRGCSADAAYQTQFPFSRILRKLWHLGWWRFKRPLINFPFRAILHKFNRIRIQREIKATLLLSLNINRHSYEINKIKILNLSKVGDAMCYLRLHFIEFSLRQGDWLSVIGWFHSILICILKLERNAVFQELPTTLCFAN